MGCIFFQVDIDGITYLYNVCNKNMRIYIYKQIRFSIIISVEYNSANTNVQGKNDMFVLFAFT